MRSNDIYLNMLMSGATDALLGAVPAERKPLTFRLGPPPPTCPDQSRSGLLVCSADIGKRRPHPEHPIDVRVALEFGAVTAASLFWRPVFPLLKAFGDDLHGRCGRVV